jgi:WD40 repeat protein
MAAGSKDGSIILRDLKDGMVFAFPVQNGHSDNVWSVAFCPDSKLLVSGGSDGKVIVWDIQKPESPIPHTIYDATVNRNVTVGPDTTPAPKAVRSVAFNASGYLLAAGCADGNVLIWEKRHDGWVPFDNFPAHIAREQENKPRSIQIICVAFSPKEDNLLAIASKDWTVNLRDVIRKKNLASGRHQDSLTGLAFSPDGGALITAGQDSTLRLWKVPKVIENSSPSAFKDRLPIAEKTPDLEEIGSPFRGHVGWVLAVAYSSDGRTVASGGTDREAILWDTQYYLPENANAAQTQEDFVMAISPGGKYEVTGYRSGVIHVS